MIAHTSVRALSASRPFTLLAQASSANRTRRRMCSSSDMDMARFRLMAQRSRRPRGQAAEAVGLYCEVMPEFKAVVDRAAEATGAAKWAVMEFFLGNVELDERGVPIGWPYPIGDQDELPFTASDPQDMKLTA